MGCSKSESLSHFLILQKILALDLSRRRQPHNDKPCACLKNQKTNDRINLNEVEENKKTRAEGSEIKSKILQNRRQSKNWFFEENSRRISAINDQLKKQKEQMV